MVEVPNIIMALIEEMSWFAIMYIVHKVYKNRPKHTEISIPGKLIIVSER